MYLLKMLSTVYLNIEVGGLHEAGKMNNSQTRCFIHCRVELINGVLHPSEDSFTYSKQSF